MSSKNIKEKQFQQILHYGLQKGNATVDVKMNDFIKELSEKLVTIIKEDGYKR